MYTEEQFNKIKAFITAKKIRIYTLKFIYKILPLFVFIAYPILLLYLLMNSDSRLLECITVPLGVFITVTLIRKFINCKRPYEKLAIEPLIPKNTKGKSFPSRHTASAAVIAMTLLYVNIPVGIVFLAIALLIGISRICAGVHFPRDVAAGYLYSVIMSVLFFYIF
ncbi:MAG: phosphatase PAP2 family protein [Clostridia bacterium]|nr:phosphatase PAP2 family protein [Clostridia bacterium]